MNKNYSKDSSLILPWKKVTGRFQKAAPALTAFLIFAPPAWTATARTSATFLQQTFGARPFAMGQAYCALGDDVFAMAYNPAALTRLKESQAAAQFIQSYSDIQIGYLGLASPLNPSNAMALSVAYLNAGKADIYDAGGNQTRSIIGERDFLLHLGYARSLELPAGHLHIGAGGKILKSALAEEVQATAYAADAGGLYEVPWYEGLASAGLAVTNLGPAITYSGGLASGSQSDPLPLTSRAALGYAKDIFSYDSLALGFELDRVFGDNNLFEGFGLEYNYHRLCAFRFGYRLGQDLGNLTFGFGLNFKGLSVDYGVGLAQTFNNVQQLSLNYRFTIPGIRYSKEAPPSPLETLDRNVQSAMASRRYFDAASEIERVRAFFPDAPDASKFTGQIQQEISLILLRGPGTSNYYYALGFKRFFENNWVEAASALEASLRADPDNREAQKYLAKARRSLGEQEKQLKLQSQARVAMLLDLATQAYESGDYARAQRIVTEILRLGPYAPAESLRRRIEEAIRRKLEPAPKPRFASPEQPSAAIRQPSQQDVAKAEQLYYEALKNYLDGHFEEALQKLSQGRNLNPNDDAIRNTLEHIQEEFNQKRRKP